MLLDELLNALDAGVALLWMRDGTFRCRRISLCKRRRRLGDEQAGTDGNGAPRVIDELWAIVLGNGTTGEPTSRFLFHGGSARREPRHLVGPLDVQ